MFPKIMDNASGFPISSPLVLFGSVPYKKTQCQVFTVEMHHQRVDFANPGDNVGLNIKGLDKNNMPRSGDASFAPML